MKTRYFNVSVLNREVKIDKDVKTWFVSHRYQNVSDASLARLNKLASQSVIYRKQPYLSFGNAV